MKVIIAGSRSITDSSAVDKAVVKSNFKITEVVCGTAKGVDQEGAFWAFFNNIPVKMFRPNWKAYGKGAGFLRNIEMGDYADALVAIWDGKSKGTQHMINYMNKIGKPVYVSCS